MSNKSGLRTFDGAVALITGGASGIGKAFGEELARRGAEVVLTDIESKMVEEAAAGIVKSGGRATSASLDVRNADAVRALVNRTFEQNGRLDYVFANAGVGVFGEVHLITDRDWDFTVDVNITGVLNTVRAVYPKMIEQGFGHIVNVASLAGLVPAPFLTAYSMTKHAVVGLSKSLRPEAARHGVRISALCPGAIRTPILTGNGKGCDAYPKLTEARILEWWKKIGPITELAPFTKDAIDAVAKNEAVIVLPKRNRALVRMLALMPGSMADKVAMKIYNDTLKNFPEIREPD